ncbi:glycosyltransferase family protein [Brenneria corticis]|uniref:Glycosyl transferase family 28 n=1 Tax=Brenneria corticis TaxID=2173106 RepID=A0A2U1TYN3_9GAMM|nr:glycosyl transferase family 28 [Brenneria sp. CFCC 11842]PWC14528.1 glycosyl transferase family 28 [Brenneria sp. CFCC 11842]
MIKVTPRLAFYSHDTMGLGHIRRNMLLAEFILTRFPAAEILLITGVREAGKFPLPIGIDTVTLPTYLKTPQGDYLPRSLGKDIRRLVMLRSRIIYSALEAFEPDILVIDNVPRGAMSELDASLPMMAQKGAHLVLGLRDIIDEPAAVRRQWNKLNNMHVIREYISSIWIYGDRVVYNLPQCYRFDRSLCQKVSFVGYLDARQRASSGKGPAEILPGLASPYALCVVGGGQDGGPLADAFANARMPAGMTGVLITGAMMPPQEKARLRERVGRRQDMLIMEFAADPLTLMRHAECVVAMGGYNTTTEILSYRKRALIVPRVTLRQEQWIRATRLAELGLVDCLHPADLTASALGDWLAMPPRPARRRAALNFNGLDGVADRVQALLAAKYADGGIHPQRENGE